MRRSSAFTLIELLVVVAIIAVLIAIMLPSLGRARETSKRAVCQTRLRAWAAGFATYAANYNDALPLDSASANAGIDATGSRAMGIWNDPYLWFNGVGEIAVGKSYDSLAASSTGLPHMGANSLFVCPSAIDAAPGDSAKDGLSNGYFLTTGWLSDGATPANYSNQQRPMLLAYGMSGKIRNIDYDYHPSATNTRAPGTRVRGKEVSKLSNLVAASTSVLLAEKRVSPLELSPNDANYTAALTPNAVDPTRFTARHSKGGNIAFADGHVEWFTNAAVNAANNNSTTVAPLQFNQPGHMVWNWTK